MGVTLTSIYSRCSQRGECRLWGGALSANGHPYVYCPDTYASKGRNYANLPGRHLVWRLVHKEPVQQGMRVMMTCRNRTCLWHGHMAKMTIAEATTFAAAGGAYQTLAHKVARTINGRKMAKLNQQKADQVRARVFAGEHREDIADELEVSRSLIDQICRGDRWVPPVIQGSSVFTFRP